MNPVNVYHTDKFKGVIVRYMHVTATMVESMLSLGSTSSVTMREPVCPDSE
jgi:hypothetical protein